ncbi:hypothetical protein INS49_003325 [Diaporthe citri]|uniref:uncharacterized protein n=1 Tax=Diaporthe citri TaxID=83186 RepID=UPI001C80CF5C|nr:uncharacterized protein INS49_003325 [Diaporthe citri]KAG6355363.1 hypothetical protein INS49_003325 [Diaporthe citri]
MHQQVTVCVATDGNQGRGLAYGAKVFGCRSVDYVHSHVSPERAKAMMDFGAIVIRIDGEYKASVDRAKEDARTITHVFVCGGVGSIAAAIFMGFYNRFCEIEKPCRTVRLPRFVVVEPAEADCLFQSAKAGEMRLGEGNLQTLMAGLACRSPSPAAWKILNWLASDFAAVPDSVAIDGMRVLAEGKHGDVPVVCGESSAANIGVLLKAGSDEVLRERLGLNENSRCVIFALEGATDPKIYKDLVGKSTKDVFRVQGEFLEQ